MLDKTGFWSFYRISIH